MFDSFMLTIYNITQNIFHINEAFTLSSEKGSFAAFLERKDVKFSFSRYFVEALGAMGIGLFASLDVYKRQIIYFCGRAADVF